MIKPPKRHRFSPTTQGTIWVQTSDNQSLSVEGLDEELLAAGFHPIPFQNQSKSFMDYLPSFLTHKQEAPPAGSAAPVFDPRAASLEQANFASHSQPPGAGNAPATYGSFQEALQSTRALKTPARAFSAPAQPRASHPNPTVVVTGARRARRGSIFPWLFSLSCLVVGLLAGYGLSKPRDNRRAAEPASFTPPPAGLRVAKLVDRLTPAEQDALDAAYAAQKSGKLAEAAQLFADLQARHPTWGSIGIELGATHIYQHDLAAARIALESSISKGQMPAEANFRLGIISSMTKDYAAAEMRFATAVALDPSRAEYYSFWGECLRQEGKPLEAIGKFRAALLRNPMETSEGLYRLKLWLCVIQANQEGNDSAGAQIDAALARPRPPMEALFAAAARNIKAGDFAAAAQQMRLARETVAPNVYSVILRDPTFAQESWRPELGEVFKL